MMLEEFEALVGHEVPEKDYAVIDEVYGYHPSVADGNGRKRLAEIYKMPSGMRIIRDMLVTAQKIDSLLLEVETHKKEMAKHQAALGKLTDEINAFR